MLRKYMYSDKAAMISMFASFFEVALVVAAFLSALYHAWIFTILFIVAAIAMWYFTKKYCSKIDGIALAEKIKNDENFANQFFEKNPQLKRWYCPKCRNVLIGAKCEYCGYKKVNMGGQKTK